MEKINVMEINFKKLQSLNNQGCNSRIYTDNKYCYKMFNGFSNEHRSDMKEKFEIIENIKVPGAVFPNKMIVNRDTLVGCVLPYIPNSVGLDIKIYNMDEIDMNRYLNIVSHASTTLRNLHENGVVVKDLHFSNVLVDDTDKTNIIDLDVCNFNEFGTNCTVISGLLNDYLYDYCNYPLDFIPQSKNLDRLSFILAFFQAIFDEPIYEVKRERYERIVKNLKTFENLSEVVDKLYDKDARDFYVPYLDDVIDLDDDMILRKV